MDKFVAQGVVVTKVACNNERRLAAERLGKSIEEVPLKYGSLRLAVNLIKLDGIPYVISKEPQDNYVKEERLILEISYKFDYENTQDTGRIIDKHSIVYNINEGDCLDITMNNAFLVEKHYMKIINPGTDRAIKTYFIKAWADDIESVTHPQLRSSVKRIRPVSVIRGININQSILV